MPDQYSGHRERLRKRFETSGFSGFHDYEVLELMLTFIFRQGDVKPVAKELIKSFGSFPQVLDATVDDLANIKGMGAASALSLHAIREAMSFYYRSKTTGKKEQVTQMSSLVEMLRANLGQRHNEVMFALFLNAKNEVLATKELGEGTVSQAPAFPRKIIEEAIKHKSTSIILAHNHPDGVAEPSEADMNVTSDMRKALALIDISLQDHIILANDDYFSFKRNNLL